MRFSDFIKRRWLEFRWGWAYISYIISGINFITITYYLLLQNLGIDIPIWMYAFFVVSTLPIVTVFIGHFYHRKRQLNVDVELTFQPLIQEIRDLKEVLEKWREES